MKQRHGCLTAWLILLIIANAITTVTYLAARDAVAENLPSGSGWAIVVLAVLAAANILFGVAIFRWKKWGFFRIVATAIVALIVNLAVGINAGLAFGGLLGVVLLYALLQVGGDRKAWPQLD